MIKRIYWHWGRASIACLTIACAFLGCSSPDVPIVPGELSLKFHDSSKEAQYSVLRVTLTNGLERPIHIRGQRTWALAIEMRKPDVLVTCSRRPGELMEANVHFLDAELDWDFFEVAPGKRVRLIIPTDSLENYAGGRCWLRVSSKDGTETDNLEFDPSAQ